MYTIYLGAFSKHIKYLLEEIKCFSIYREKYYVF